MVGFILGTGGAEVYLKMAFMEMRKKYVNKNIMEN